MKTDDLITALAADLPSRPARIQTVLPLALIFGAPISFGLLFYTLHVRPDFWAMVIHPRFVFKFAFTVSVFAAGVWLIVRTSRPGMRAGPARIAFGASAVLLLIAVSAELATLPAAQWRSAWMGGMAMQCLMLIPVLAAAPLAALLYALRAGAPDNPALLGAAAGLVSGALAATLYASHCTDDSPLFLATWYVLAIAAVTLAGSLIGSRVLRW
jgi:hypothetical protein